MELIFEDDLLTIRRVAVGGMDNNAYALTARADGSQFLIDAAAEPAKLERLLASVDGDTAAEPHLTAILTTHQHPDHVGALATLVGSHPVTTLAGVEDAEAISARTGVVIDRRLRHGDELRLGQARLGVIALRGHTPGSVALAYSVPGLPSQIFTGDSLFPGGVGNTNGDAARFESLLGDVIARIFDVFPDDTVVHPGHGRPTTLGAERSQLGEWRARGW